MSDLPLNFGGEEDQPEPRPLSQPPQALEDFRNSVPEEMQPWADHASALIHDFMVRDQIARDNADLGEAYTNTLNGMRDTLSGVVRNNPAATDLALGLWGSISAQAVIGHPNLPPEAHGPLTEALYKEGGKEIATNAVMSGAQRDAGFAHDLLGKVSQYFNESELSALSGNITALDFARAADAAGEEAQAKANQKQASENRLLGYNSEFQDREGRPTIPTGGFIQRVTNDTRPDGLTASQAAVLRDKFQKATGVATREAQVGVGGGEGYPAGMVEGTNYQVATDTARRLANGTLSLADVIKREGPGLAPHDANLLMHMAKADPEGLPQFNNIIEAERMRLVGKDGETLGGQSLTELDNLTRKILSDWRTGGKGTLLGHPSALVAARSKADTLEDPIASKQYIRELLAQKQFSDIVNAPAKERAEALRVSEFDARQELARTRLEGEEQRRAQTETERQQREAQQQAVHADAANRVAERVAEQDRRERNREIEAQQREVRAEGRAAGRVTALDAFRHGLRSTGRGA